MFQWVSYNGMFILWCYSSATDQYVDVLYLQVHMDANNTMAAAADPNVTCFCLVIQLFPHPSLIPSQFYSWTLYSMLLWKINTERNQFHLQCCLCNNRDNSFFPPCYIICFDWEPLSSESHISHMLLEGYIYLFRLFVFRLRAKQRML